MAEGVGFEARRPGFAVIRDERITRMNIDGYAYFILATNNAMIAQTRTKSTFACPYCSNFGCEHRHRQCYSVRQWRKFPASDLPSHTICGLFPASSEVFAAS
jgi:hypothetical protein